jgi:hypothetical protein
MNKVKITKEEDLSLNISYYYMIYDFGNDNPPKYYDDLSADLWNIWIEIIRLKYRE